MAENTEKKYSIMEVKRQLKDIAVLLSRIKAKNMVRNWRNDKLLSFIRF